MIIVESKILAKRRYCTKKDILLSMYEYSNCLDCFSFIKCCLTSSRISNGENMDDMVKNYLRIKKLERILV